jgi:hypothetical protein
MTKISRQAQRGVISVDTANETFFSIHTMKWVSLAISADRRPMIFLFQLHAYMHYVSSSLISLDGMRLIVFPLIHSFI